MNKVLRISTHPSNKRHGVGLHSSMISKSKLHETVFVAPKLPSGDEYPAPEEYKLIELKTGLTKRPRGKSLFGRLLFQLTRVWEILKTSWESIVIYEKSRFNIVHIHSPMYSLVAVWCKLRGSRVFITYHGTDYLRVRFNKIYRLVANKFIGVGVCISPHMLEDMSKFHAKTEYIYNGVDSNVFVDLNLNREKFLFAVGSLKYEKAYDRLIEGFAQFSFKHPTYKLFIAGDGETKGKILEQIEELGLTEKVVLLGNLNKSELISYYNRCSGFVLTSHSEGFPKVVLEAIFCGARVVVNNVGSVSSFLPENVIMQNNEPETIYQFLTELVEDKIEFSAINVSQLKKKYSWESVTKKYNKLYE